MPHAHSAYHVIQDELQNYCNKLMKFPRLGHWVHETVVANYIGLPKGVGEHGQSESFHSLHVSRLGKEEVKQRGM